MDDAAEDLEPSQQAGKLRIHPRSAAAGAAGGAGISMALFTTLNVKGVIANPHFGPNYALMIFCLALVAVFFSAVLALPGRIGPDRRGIVVAGFALVGLLAAAAASPFVIDGLIHPTLTVEGALVPDLGAFVDDDTVAPVKLSATLDNQSGPP